jgi:hypothetical protein
LGEKKKERKRKKKDKWLGGFFTRAGHALLAVVHGIFPAVRYN